MRLFHVALRNLQRNRRRSLATALTVAIGVAALLLFGGFRADLIKLMLTGYVRTTGHLVVQHQDFFEYGSGNPAQYSIAKAQAVQDALLSQPDLAARIHVITPMLVFPAVAGHAARETSKTVLVNGLEPQDQSRMREWNHYGVRMPSTPHPLAGKPPHSALLGMGVARMLQLCAVLPQQGQCGAAASSARSGDGSAAVNDDLLALAQSEHAQTRGTGKGPAMAADRSIEILAATTRGVPNVQTFEVIGAESQGFKEMDDAYLIVGYQSARALLFGRGATQATSINIQLKNPDDLPWAMQRARAVLARQFPAEPLAVRSVHEVIPFIDQTVSMFNTIFGFIAMLIVAVVMFTIANTVSTAILERTTEIGTIRALGLLRGTVMRLFLTEAMLLALAGAVLGIGASVVLEALINAMHLTWRPPGGAEDMPLTVSVFREAMMVGGVLALSVVFATLAAVPAARKASRLKIVDALRYT